MSGQYLLLAGVVCFGGARCLYAWVRFELRNRERNREHHERVMESLRRRHETRLWALYREREYHRALLLRERRLRLVDAEGLPEKQNGRVEEQVFEEPTSSSHRVLCIAPDAARETGKRVPA